MDTCISSNNFLKFSQSSEAFEVFFPAEIVTSSSYTPKDHRFSSTQKIDNDLFMNLTSWKIVRPWFINVEKDEDGSFIVSDNEFYVFGYGESQLEAMEDYKISIIEYYEILEEKDDSPTKALLNFLKSHLRKNAN